jgi:hypothetical protein
MVSGVDRKDREMDGGDDLVKAQSRTCSIRNAA